MTCWICDVSHGNLWFHFCLRFTEVSMWKSGPGRAECLCWSEKTDFGLRSDCGTPNALWFFSLPKHFFNISYIQTWNYLQFWHVTCALMSELRDYHTLLFSELWWAKSNQTLNISSFCWAKFDCRHWPLWSRFPHVWRVSKMFWYFRKKFILEIMRSKREIISDHCPKPLNIFSPKLLIGTSNDLF